MSRVISSTDHDQFDEAAYLERYPDVARAVAEKRVASAQHHYTWHGRREGRIGTKFDPSFYLRAYPLAEEEIAAGAATGPADHYLRLGRGRGYLPYPQAPRPDNAATSPSPFGGLWPDQANADDIIEGRLEIGEISEQQATLLRFWIKNGYVILESAISPELVDRACADLDKAYAGGFPDLLFECHDVAGNHIRWQPEINPFPAKALDIHHFSPAVRDLIFAPSVAAFLGLIFQSKAFASQTLAFLRGSAQSGHQDSAYVPYTSPRQFAATWIALEDVTIGAGELFYYEGSHRLEDFLFLGRFKSVPEAARSGAAENLQSQIDAHLVSLEERAKARELKKLQFAAKKGDVLFWHADLVHGGNPVSQSVTRKSIVTHYCPKRLAPLFAERTPVRLFHHDGHLYTSQQYTSFDPLRGE
jgi:hypothetical protein